MKTPQWVMQCRVYNAPLNTWGHLWAPLQPFTGQIRGRTRGWVVSGLCVQVSHVPRVSACVCGTVMCLHMQVCFMHVCRSVSCVCAGLSVCACVAGLCHMCAFAGLCCVCVQVCVMRVCVHTLLRQVLHRRIYSTDTDKPVFETRGFRQAHSPLGDCLSFAAIC